MPAATLNSLGERVVLAGVFASATLRYWLTVFPRTWIELGRWRRRADFVDDPAVRHSALEAIAKQGNLEGAAAFAVLCPSRQRGPAVRALVAFQALYNYVDHLAEQPGPDPVGTSRRLHEALLVALDPVLPASTGATALPDDGGLLAEMVDVCRTAVGGLPSHASVIPALQVAVARIVAFQSLSLGAPGPLERWVHAQVGDESGLEWWEAAAGAGSSLAVFALIAAAAAPAVRSEEIVAIDGAYFPSIGALHSLLDSLVDVAEDEASGQLSLVGCYPSRRDAVLRMGGLADRALRAARTLPRGRAHAVLVTAMACNYLSAPEARDPDVLGVSRAVRSALGPLAAPALLIFKARRVVGRFGRGRSRHQPDRGSGTSVYRGEVGESDARAA